MTIAAGLLDQRVVVRTLNPLAKPVTKDSLGNLVPADGQILHKDTPRWAGLISSDYSEQETGVVVLPDGAVVFRMRRDSFTKDDVRIGNKIQWLGDWYAITARGVDIRRNHTFDFVCVSSDDVFRVDDEDLT